MNEIHTLPKLNYPFDALEPIIDAKTIEIHYTKHHQTYITNLVKALENLPEFKNMNIESLLSNIENLPQEKKQVIINNGGGHANHTLYWEIMTPGGRPSPTEDFLEKMNLAFDSFDNFKKLFIEAAISRFGSGWAWLVKNKENNLQVYSTPNQDSPIMNGDKPLIGVDVWEHAYYLNYQNKRAEYVEKWIDLINWEIVESKFKA